MSYMCLSLQKGINVCVCIETHLLTPHRIRLAPPVSDVSTLWAVLVRPLRWPLHTVCCGAGGGSSDCIQPSLS